MPESDINFPGERQEILKENRDYSRMGDHTVGENISRWIKLYRGAITEFLNKEREGTFSRLWGKNKQTNSSPPFRSVLSGPQRSL